VLLMIATLHRPAATALAVRTGAPASGSPAVPASSPHPGSGRRRWIDSAPAASTRARV